MADTKYFVDVTGLAHYHDTQVKPTITNVATLQGYFDNGVAKNANQLAGHNADYFATADALSQLANGMTWGAAVADAAALKAIKAPKDTETRALLDTNAIYQFNDTATETADVGTDVYVPDDKTPGAWKLLSHMVYTAATQTADGLMSKEDKKFLDGVQGKLDGKVDKVNGKGLSTNDYTTAEKNKLATLANTAGVFFATVDVGSDTDVNQSDLNIPDGVAIKVGDTIIDNQGGQYTVTTVTAASGSGDTAVPAKVHVSAVGLQLALKSSVDGKVDKVNGKGLSTNDYDAAAKGKLDGLANIKAIGTNLALDAKTGTLNNTYALPTAGDNLGGIKNGGNVVVGADGTANVTIPEAQDVQAATNDMIDAAFGA